MRVRVVYDVVNGRLARDNLRDWPDGRSQGVSVCVCCVCVCVRERESERARENGNESGWVVGEQEEEGNSSHVRCASVAERVRASERESERGEWEINSTEKVWTRERRTERSEGKK
jgi:hypothetical protein